jgi:phosphoribosylformimino-5-aminoimidazole carboxamide ribotide isomerase
MQCIPAIDVRDGRCVRLYRGSFDAETVYGDPVEQARDYVGKGASALHVVDLDAARTGEPVNRAVVAAMVAAVPVPVQYGGGVRSRAAALEALDLGIDRVVLGTFAIEEPALVRELAESYPGRIVVGLDHRRVETSGALRREVAVRGWEEGAGVELFDALAPFEGAPLGGIVVTDISRDGTLSGPDLEGYAELLDKTALAIVASGGIGELADLERLAALEVDGRRLAAVVVGRALLDGRFSVEEAVAACAT